VVHDPQPVHQGLQALEAIVVVRATERLRLREPLEIGLGALKGGQDFGGDAGPGQAADELPVQEVEQEERRDGGHRQCDEAPPQAHGDSTTTATLQEYVIRDRRPMEAAIMAP
jgi:hypothetical protein